MKKELLPGAEQTAMGAGIQGEVAATEAPITPEAPTMQEEAPDDTKTQIQAIIEKYFPGTQTPHDEAVLDLLTRLDRVHEKLMVAVENDPDFGAALSEMFQGGNARTAIVRAYGPDAFEAVEGDPDYDQMTEAYNQGKERLTKRKETEATLQKNREMSVKEIETWLEEKGYGDEEVIARLKLMDEIKSDFMNDKITKKHLEILDKAMDYDTAVSDASEAGKVAGRNEALVAKRSKEKVATDGLPELTSATPKPKEEKKKSFGSSFLDGVI